MVEAKPAIKMPELLVFARAFAVGIVGAEVIRVMFYLGETFAQTISNIPLCMQVLAILACLILCVLYAKKRGVYVTAARLGRSFRLDLLAAIAVGAWSNELASPLLEFAHKALKHADPRWAPAVLAFLGVLLLSPLVRLYWPRSKRLAPQLYFIADDEIADEEEDLLENGAQAKSFAETVLASGAHTGLVYGIDGPWGVGKTSFINLAEKQWESDNSVIVCRFEPLRYASEPDLAERLIRDMSAAIQRQVFVPEFRSTASRYSRLLKGRADISFFGFKLSLEPTVDTIDDLLDDIDDVLKRIGRRVIIVIDDLDRLDSKTVNSVLFAVRRTFKLSQATYVLCYDTENLAGRNDDGEKAREFLEKFVTVKLSLFVDSARIVTFLQRNWQRPENKLATVPSDTMVKLGSVLSEVADILVSNQAAHYLPLLGDFRKVKRFVNAMLLMEIEKTDLGRTDFNKRDLINLMLLHLNYPGIFRSIYAEETEGRSGTFSIKRGAEKPEFENSAEFTDLLTRGERPGQFLLKQLFHVSTLGFENSKSVEEAVRSSRACFNEGQNRNLEKYLKLIVRFVTPEPRETFVLYQDAVLRAIRGAAIESILTSSDFRLEVGEHSHDQFWRVLVNQSYDLTRNVAEDAIDTLIKYLPRYSFVSTDNRGLRQPSIYSLLRLLDRAGWGRTAGRRLSNSSNNTVEVARRIYGEHEYKGKGLIQRLASSERGVLGWYDLMLFRLQCSADRQGQVYNVHSALIVHDDASAKADGLVTDIALKGMRTLSQEVFSHFKRTYIEPKRNFMADVNSTRHDEFLGNAAYLERDTLKQNIDVARSNVKAFVMYQLGNSYPPTGSGVGCGFYDESGTGDGGGIARLVNEYAFEVCFNPDIHEDNIFHFLDHCLTHLSSAFFSGGDEKGFVPTKGDMPGGLDPWAIGMYWHRRRDQILRRDPSKSDRCVATSNYIASYRYDLTKVFTVLDDLSKDALGVIQGP